MEYNHVVHEIAPVFDENSKILILGSFPSVKSRQQQFFYGHPQNRFWKVVAEITENNIPESIEEKKLLLLKNKIAIWDVIESCDITGSSDSSIKNVTPTDLKIIFEKAKIQAVFANGATAKKLYEKYQKPLYGKSIIGLPSTSPANAAFSMEKLLDKWIVIKDYLVRSQI